ncbi:hypothetical protein F5I97DRAFT_2056348 [Phlebopus sp. FC_14]|nr:hypothetical protein F5I97DRAFT_2056348 [Phlebopus sp. FC_14]
MDSSMQRAIEVLSTKLSTQGFDATDRYPALETIRPCLEERGYFLYHHFYDIDWHGLEDAMFSYPHFQDDEPNSAPQLPYSFYGGGSTYKDQQHAVQSPPMYYMTYAQDYQHRHVALKLTKEGSVEYEAYRRLSQEKSLYVSDLVEFGCVMPPLDFVDLGDGWWFVVMPRWGDCALIPWFGSIREVLHFIRSCLKGLSVLHKHLIIHRDIKSSNILVNHFAQGNGFEKDDLRPILRKTGRLSYALMDFDWSIVFPLDSKPSDRRLPASESFIWFCSFANDTAQGELDYDPFVFDVGSLGMFFCEQFQVCTCYYLLSFYSVTPRTTQHLSNMVPMLAPFLDRMITRDLPTRFTATEALSFFDDYVVPSVGPTRLDICPPSHDTDERQKPEVYDRWAGLDADFVEIWAAYRLPPLEWSTKVLRWICYYPFGYTVVQSIRKIGLIGGTRARRAQRAE